MSAGVMDVLTCRAVIKCVGDSPTSAVKSVYFLLYVYLGVDIVHIIVVI